MTDAIEVQKAGARQIVTQQMIDQAAVDVRSFVRAELLAKLKEVTDGSRWVDHEIEMTEVPFIEPQPVFADDADWDDDDNPPEPIGYVDVPMVEFRATVKFAR